MGNGRATAIAFAREGATVVLADRDEASARETAETIGERASVVVADVGVEDDCARIVATCLERHGRVDVLHHNVGIGTGDGWAERSEERRVGKECSVTCRSDRKSTRLNSSHSVTSRMPSSA